MPAMGHVQTPSCSTAHPKPCRQLGKGQSGCGWDPIESLLQWSCMHARKPSQSLGLGLTSMVRMGVWMMGPSPPAMSKGMFMPDRGVRMSENRITPSGLKAFQGCRETST